MVNKIIFSVPFLFSHFIIHSQDLTIKSKFSSSKIQVDGVSNDEFWSQTKSVVIKYNNFPDDKSKPYDKTIIRVLNDDNYLYVFAELKESDSLKKINATTLRRDFEWERNDSFAVILNPLNDNLNGYGFYVNKFGVQSDEQISNGNFNETTWDCKWFSETKITSTGWNIEIAIPLRALKYKNGNSWKINFGRVNVFRNEINTWSLVPRNFKINHLAFTGTLKFEKELISSKFKTSIIPSITFTNSRLHSKVDSLDNSKSAFEVSLDAKLRVGKSLNLDLTVNPDFSQAEVDAAVINLSRFELFFPEKRLFFIENNDVFGQLSGFEKGAAIIIPFYSRRIGLNFNPLTNQFEQVGILGGVRLTGNIDDTNRIGLLNIQTESQNTPLGGKLSSQNYSALAYKKSFNNRSSIGIIATNKQSTKKLELDNLSQFNRVVGLNYDLESNNSKLKGKFFYTQSFTDRIEGNLYSQATHGSYLKYDTEKYSIYFGHNYIGTSFNAETGFVPRTGLINFYSEFSKRFYPKINFINNLRPVIHYDTNLDTEWKISDNWFQVGSEIQFQDQSNMFILYINQYTRLINPFDPSGKGNLTIDAGKSFNYGAFNLVYNSNKRKKFFYNTEFVIGNYFNGNRSILVGSLNYRFQPYLSLGFNYSYFSINLPDPFSDSDNITLGSIIDLTLSKKLFLKSIVQHLNRDNQFKIYSNLQWNFSPLSNLFFVLDYRDFGDLNESEFNLSLKLTYWLN